MHTQSLSKEENWISQFLDKIDPLLTKSFDVKHSKITLKFFEFIYQKAVFNGDSMLHISLKSDDLQLFDRLWHVVCKFEMYGLLRIRNYNKETCLHLASAMNRANVLREVIMYGGDVNAVDGDGNTALHVAVQTNNNNCVVALLSTNCDAWGKEINIDLSIFNDDGYTPLHLATMNKNLNVVKMLNATVMQMKKPIFDDVEGKHGNNALHIAIESEAHEVAEYLIQNKCINPTKMNKSGHTALYLARVANENDLIDLIQRYASIDDDHIKNDDDDTSSKDSFESQEINKTNEVNSSNI